MKEGTQGLAWFPKLQKIILALNIVPILQSWATENGPVVCTMATIAYPVFPRGVKNSKNLFLHSYPTYKSMLHIYLCTLKPKYKASSGRFLHLLSFKSYAVVYISWVKNAVKTWKKKILLKCTLCFPSVLTMLAGSRNCRLQGNSRHDYKRAVS